MGASVGEYGIIMREIGFNGKIISFEPREVAYNELILNSKSIIIGFVVIMP